MGQLIDFYIIRKSKSRFSILVTTTKKSNLHNNFLTLSYYIKKTELSIKFIPNSVFYNIYTLTVSLVH